MLAQSYGLSVLHIAVQLVEGLSMRMVQKAHFTCSKKACTMRHLLCSEIPHYLVHLLNGWLWTAMLQLIRRMRRAWRRHSRLRLPRLIKRRVVLLRNGRVLGRAIQKKPEEVAEVIVQPKAKFRPKRKAAPRKVPVDSNAVQQKTVRLKKKNSGKQGGEEQATVEVGDLSIPDTPRDNQSQQTTPRDTQPTPRGEAATKFANRAMEEMHGKSDNSEQVIAERDALQEVVKQFVRAACRGVQCIYIDLSSGGSASAQYKIDDSLTTMTVTLASGGSFECSLDKIKECTLYEEFGTQLPVLQRLTPEHQKRTILVECQGPEGAGDSQWLCLLEASSDMADRFVTCLEILRLYGVSQTSAQGNTPRAH